MIVISGLLDQFYQDPYIRITEAEHLISQIVTALRKIKDVFRFHREFDRQELAKDLEALILRAREEPGAQQHMDSWLALKLSSICPLMRISIAAT